MVLSITDLVIMIGMPVLRLPLEFYKSSVLNILHQSKGLLGPGMVGLLR